MFAQCNINQATDQCAIMHTKGWLYCWVAKHNSSVEFAQGLASNLQKETIYETIRESEEIFFSLLFTQGDRKTAVLLGCNPRSSAAMSTFKKILRWAKLNGLSLEIRPNINTDDAEATQLLVELGLPQAHPSGGKGTSSAKEGQKAESHQHELENTKETPKVPFWKKLFGRNEQPPNDQPKEASRATPSNEPPNLMLIIYDSAPIHKEAFVQSVLKSLHIPNGSDTQIAAHQNNDAQNLEMTLPFAIGLATRYLKEKSLQLQVDSTTYERFKVTSPLETIQGHAIAFFAKP